MKTFLIILIINFILLILLFLYCSCKVASLADKEMERLSLKDKEDKE